MVQELTPVTQLFLETVLTVRFSANLMVVILLEYYQNSLTIQIHIHVVCWQVRYTSMHDSNASG